MRLLTLTLAALALLAACTPKHSPVIVEEEVEVIDPSVGAAYEPACIPGEDDGIGGTGCQIY